MVLNTVLDVHLRGHHIARLPVRATIVVQDLQVADQTVIRGIRDRQEALVPAIMHWKVPMTSPTPTSIRNIMGNCYRQHFQY